MKHIKWIKYRNAKLCEIDYTGLEELELIHAVKKVEKNLTELAKKDLLVILHLGGLVPTDPILLSFKNTARNLKPFIKKVGISGLKGIKKLYLSAIIQITGINAKAFDSVKPLKEWLVSKG